MANLELNFNGLERDLKMEAYVRAEMKSWMRRQGGDCAAKVEFFPAENLARVGCYIETVNEGSVSRNFEYGKGASSAFFLCLKGLEYPGFKQTTEERSA